MEKSTAQTTRNTLLSFTSAHGLVEAKQNSAFRRVLLSFDALLPDGRPLFLLGKLKRGSAGMEHHRSLNVFQSFMTLHEKHPHIGHFFCGGNEGVAQRLKKICLKRWPKTKVKGTHTPPYASIEDFDYAGLAKEIRQAGANMVWIGLSTPKQEFFAYQLAKHLKGRVLLTVGALFDSATGQKPKVPPLLTHLCMEWLFRTFSEPKRLFKRYAKVVPLFIFYYLRTLWKR